MVAKLSLFAIAALAFFIVMIIIGRLGKVWVFDLRATILTILAAFALLAYIYWKSRST